MILAFRVVWNGPLQFSSTHKIFVSLDLPIVSKLYVLQTDKDKAIPDIEQYTLNLSNLDNAPANSLAQARAVRESELLNSSAEVLTENWRRYWGKSERQHKIRKIKRMVCPNKNVNDQHMDMLSPQRMNTQNLI